MSDPQKIRDDDELHALLGAVLEASRHPLPVPKARPEALDAARSAYLKAVRRRQSTVRARWRWHHRWSGLGAAGAGFLLALLGGTVAYLLYDQPEVLETHAFIVPAHIEGVLLVEAAPPLQPVWIVKADETSLTSESILVAPAGAPTRIRLPDSNLTIVCYPGARLSVDRGKRLPLELLHGRADIEFLATEAGPDAALLRRGIQILARGKEEQYSTLLELEAVSSRVAVFVDGAGGCHSAQVMLLSGSASLRRGPRIATQVTRLEPGACFLISGAAVARFDPDGEARPPPSGEPAWAGVHWAQRGRAGRGDTTPEDAKSFADLLRKAGLPAVPNLTELARTGSRPDSAELSARHASLAVRTLGLLDTYDAMSALVTLEPLGGRLHTECLRSLAHFQDPHVQSFLEQAFLSEPDANVRALLALSLARRSYGLLRQASALTELLSEPTLSPLGRIDALEASALTLLATWEGDAAPPVAELLAIANQTESVPSELTLAAVAALEELALRNVTPAALALTQLVEFGTPAIANAATVALVRICGRTLPPSSPGARAEEWRTLLRAR